MLVAWCNCRANIALMKTSNAKRDKGDLVNYESNEAYTNSVADKKNCLVRVDLSSRFFAIAMFLTYFLMFIPYKIRLLQLYRLLGG